MNKNDQESMKIVEDILTKVFTCAVLVTRVACGAIAPGFGDIKKEVNFARDLGRGAAKAVAKDPE